MDEIFNAVMCECLARRMSISKAHVTPTGGGCISFKIYLQNIKLKSVLPFYVLIEELNKVIIIKIIRLLIFKSKYYKYLIKNNDKVIPNS